MSHFIVVFQIKGVTAEDYHVLLQEIIDAGLSGNPDSSQHIAAPTADGWMVIEIWKNKASFEAFLDQLMPMMQKHGVVVERPEIFPVHLMIPEV